MAHWPDPQSNVSASRQAIEYGRSFAAAVDSTAARISDGTLVGINDVWSHATDWRVSQLPSTAPAELAGEFRRRRGAGDFSMTPLDERYAYLIDRIKDSPLSSRLSGFGARPDVELLQLKSTGLLSNGESVPLTHLVVPFKADSHLSAVINDGAAIRPLMSHTEGSQVNTILAEVDRLSTHLSDLTTDAERVSQLGEIHWWLSHAMPDERGSAAKSELTVRALASTVGLTLPPFKQGVIPDLEAFVTSQDGYRSNYGRLFERPHSV